MIDAPLLLKDLQSQLRLLEADLRLRLEEDTPLRETLETEHAQALAVERTAASFGAWRDERVTQAAVAWLLACVFVRFAEDNHLVADIHLAGPGEQGRMAADAQTHYFQQHPAHNDRDWLLSAFRALSAYPAAAPLFDERHNPLWQLPVSADAASQLLEFWRRRDADSGALVHDFRDSSWETRFLGDLYQDLSDYAKKTYALLQTPEFVEEFLLDRTLEPAIAERGLNGLRMIDPTCGSGHFLLGGFNRLLRHWREEEPGTDERTLVARALDSIYGIDLNPFAVAIARFRLTIAALRESGLRRLADAPAFTVHLAVGDSLLHGRIEGMFAGMDDAALRLSEHAYATEDADVLREMLEPDNGYDVVVGNPPYITPKDKALNTAYRKRYKSCAGFYALSAPFVERFFALATDGGAFGSGPGYVGMITSNSFMKREFGKQLIEGILPSWDVNHILDLSGAYIPGHGTPTVIILGRRRSPVLTTVRVAMGIRGEPRAPEDASKGLVWTALMDQVDRSGSESNYISVADLPRSRFSRHPWSISGGGGASELLEKLNALPVRVKDRTARVGLFADSHADEIFTVARRRWVMSDSASLLLRESVRGDATRDWAVGAWDLTTFPYNDRHELLSELEVPAAVRRYFWPHRTVLWTRSVFGGLTYRSVGRAWWEWHQLPKDSGADVGAITWGEIATHNHFVLRLDATVYNRTAPVIKLPAGADVEDYLELLGPLNSSIGCFWLKQVCFDKGNGGIGGGISDEAWEHRFAFNGSKVELFPLPNEMSLHTAPRMQRLAQKLSATVAELGDMERVPTRAHLDDLATAHASILANMIAWQEELDWECYLKYGILEENLTAPEECVPPLALGERAFEVALARRMAAGEESTEWFARHGSSPRTTLPEHWPAAYRQVVERRISLIKSNPDLALIERPECKRRWLSESWEERERRALREWLLNRLEDPEFWIVDSGGGAQAATRSVAELADALREDAEFLSVLALYTARPDADLVAELGKLVADEAVPYLSSLRYSDSGQRTRAEWEQTWALQWAEDAGADVGTIPVPPKYKDKDFQRKSYWALRGKLDVPKERFISYPLAGRDADPTVLLGWAGWDHVQQAQALATVIVERREVDGWGAERLVPLLAGLAELEPWVHQWHAGVDPAYGTTPGAFYTEFLEDTLRECELTRDDLGTWRPPTPSRGRPRKTR